MNGYFPSRRKFLAGAAAGAGCGSAAERPQQASGGSAAPSRLIRNARIVLATSCRARPGESLLILADDVMMPLADGISRAALELGLIPAIMDIRPYLGSDAYRRGYVMKAVAEAMDGADIVLQNLADTWVPNRPSYGRLSGDPLMQDRL